MTAIDRLREAVKMSESYPATIVNAREVAPLLEAYDGACAQAAYWHDEARRHAESAAYWRAQAEGLRDQRRDVGADHEGSTYD